MIDPKTYEKALRAARNVARSSGRAAVGLGLLANTTGCLGSDSTGGTAPGDADAALSDATADAVSDIVDAVMADLAMDTTTTPETQQKGALAGPSCSRTGGRVRPGRLRPPRAPPGDSDVQASVRRPGCSRGAVRVRDKPYCFYSPETSPAPRTSGSAQHRLSA